MFGYEVCGRRYYLAKQERGYKTGKATVSSYEDDESFVG